MIFKRRNYDIYPLLIQIMSVPYAPTAIKIPYGFQSVLEELARAVLKDQPQDILKYSAIFFEERLRHRDGMIFTSYQAYNSNKV